MAEKGLKRYLKDTTTMAFVVTIIAWILSAVLIPGFNTFKHNVQFLQTALYLGIIVIGQAFAIITGGIDLSVSGVVTLSTVVASAAVQRGYHPGVAILLALTASVIVGFLNGAGVAFLRIPPIIMTMAMLSLIEGVLLIATNGTPPSGVAASMTFLSKGEIIPGIPNVIFIYILLAAFALWFMSKSKWGRMIYAMGSNEASSWLSGVHVKKMKILIYVLSALFSGIAGIMLLGYMGSTYLTIGTPYQLFSIAAVVIGGISISGGKGKYVGIIAGTLLISLIKDILVVARVSPAGRELFQGVLILVILLAYGRERKQR